MGKKRDDKGVELTREETEQLADILEFFQGVAGGIEHQYAERIQSEPGVAHILEEVEQLVRSNGKSL